MTGDTTMVSSLAPATKTKTCVHHWVVRSPEGSTSWGSCRKCGKRKRFINSFDGYDRSNNSDIFADGARSWKPDRRATYYHGGVTAAYEEAQRAAASA